MLQEFLNANLLPITDDGYFDKLKKVSEGIAKKLVKNKAKVVNYSLAAIDPEVSVTNPDILEVKELVTKSWNTFAANTKDSAVTFIRAVMLEALQIISEDTNLGNLIWFSTRNLYQHYKSLGQEEEIVFNFLNNLGQKIENEAGIKWSFTAQINLEKVKFDIKEITGVSMDKSSLQKLLSWASGPHDENDIVPFKDPNPEWPTNGANWVYSFVPKAALAITQEVNKSLKSQNQEILTNQNLLKESINNLLQQLQNEIIQHHSLLHLKSQLLWWKEASYSSAIKTSYRNQSNGLLEVILAYDYSEYIPMIYPVSVDYFLKEVHRGLSKNPDKKINLDELFDLIQNSEEALKNFIREPKIESNRTTLLNFIIGLIWGKSSKSEIKELVGIPAETEISYSDFTVWLFHDCLTQKMIINN